MNGRLIYSWYFGLVLDKGFAFRAQLKNFISLSRAELEVIEEPNAADEESFCLKIPSNLNAPLASVKKPEAFATICSSDLMVG